MSTTKLRQPLRRQFIMTMRKQQPRSRQNPATSAACCGTKSEEHAALVARLDHSAWGHPAKTAAADRKTALPFDLQAVAVSPASSSRTRQAGVEEQAVQDRPALGSRPAKISDRWPGQPHNVLPFPLAALTASVAGERGRACRLDRPVCYFLPPPRPPRRAMSSDSVTLGSTL